MSSLEYELEFLSKLIEIDTESVSKEGYGKCASLITKEAEKASLDVEVIDGEKGAKDGLSRPNVVVTLDAGSSVTLLLESHFDVVPPGQGWRYPPFELKVENGKAYGRGTSDNKASVAAAVGAMRRLKKEKLNFNLKLVADVDEEVGGRYGLDYVLSDYGLKGNAGLILDAGPERLYLGASGSIWGKITILGKQGHSGYPFKAKNAISEAIRLLAALEPYKEVVEKKESVLRAPPHVPRQFVWGRYSVTMFNAGQKENVIPGSCEVRFDRRLLPEEPVEQAEKELKAFFEKALQETGCDAKLELTLKVPGYHTPKEHAFVKTVSRSIKKTIGHELPFAGELGGNNGTFLAKNGIPVVCYGPIREDTNYHGVDEFVYVEDLMNTRDLILNLGKAKAEGIA